MASKAQFGYAEQIVKYFDKRPDAGVELDVDEVLDNMDVWANRHIAHKTGRAWLDDNTRANIRAEFLPVARRIENASQADGRAADAYRTARRTQSADVDALAAKSRELRTTWDVERRAGAKLVAETISQHPAFEVEILSIAHRVGLA